MSEFVGRTGSLRLYSYPEPRRSGGAVQALARNFDYSAKNTGGVSDSYVIVTWSDGEDYLPITPLVTGIVEVSGIVIFTNESNDTPVNAFVEVFVDGVIVPGMSSVATIGPEETVSVPFLFQAEGLDLNVEAEVSLRLIASADQETLEWDAATMAIQEVAASTG